MMSDSTVTYNKKSLVRAIGKGVVVPIISNGFRIEEIFREDEELCRMMAELPQFYDEFRTFDQQLTKKWAASVDYPMSDDHNLARVAQYLQVEQGNSSSRENYLQFLIDRLLTLSEQNEKYKNDENFQNTVSELRKPSKGQLPLFSDVASQLGYPQFPLPGMPGSEDPLRLLARMPVKVYITTSYSNFLERALLDEDKTPHTQVCFCKPSFITDPDHLPARDLRPTEKNPAVVHLFGLEDYTKTLVLSEDDYINFLMNAGMYIEKDDMVPSYLRSALTDPDSTLLLLGYHLRDWDFRTLFRFLSRIRDINNLDSDSIAIQFKPRLGRVESESKSRLYLENYFKKGRFMVEWNNAEKFIYELWDAWKA